jgi:hypothetical protein
MLEISDVMDVTVDDLSPEKLQQLKDATDQFQMKCLMSFKKNRSGVPYLKTEMPRVLLSGETNATSFQEKKEALQAFRDTAEAVLGRHHKAFLGMFKHMMVGVFGPGMEQVFSGVSRHTYSAEVGRPVLLNQQELNHHCRANRPSLLHKALGDNRSSLLHKALGVSRCNLLCGAWGVSQSSHLYKKVNQFSSPTHINLHMGIWHSVRLECRPIPLTR